MKDQDQNCQQIWQDFQFCQSDRAEVAGLVGEDCVAAVEHIIDKAEILLTSKFNAPADIHKELSTAKSSALQFLNALDSLSEGARHSHVVPHDVTHTRAQGWRVRGVGWGGGRKS